QSAGVVHEQDIGAERTRRLADRSQHALIDLLDQTGQGVARLPDEKQSDQVLRASDWAEAFAGAGSGEPIWKEAGAVIAGPDGRAGLQRAVGLDNAGEHQEGATRARQHASGHGRLLDY